MTVHALQERPAAAHQDDRPSESSLVAVLLILTLVTGLVDATTYLGLGRVFAANMTGNIVLLGFALAGAGGISAAASLVSLAAFLVGSAAGGVLARNLEAHRHRWVATALVLETIGLCLAAGSAALALSGYVIVALLALAMGVRNATVRRLAVPDLTTTVLTMTLTGLGAELVGSRGSRKVPTRRIASVLAMLVGALIGALLLSYAVFAPLALAGGLLVLTTAALFFAGRGDER
jgi:uncharacterized membrane protein YoaK (UPF0700 family)